MDQKTVKSARLSAVQVHEVEGKTELIALEFKVGDQQQFYTIAKSELPKIIKLLQTHATTQPTH